MDGVGGSGSGACPFLRRTSTKRSLSTMAEGHRSASPDTLFVQDDHYDNEHTSQRSRLEPANPYRIHGLALPRPPHFAGDGLDFRRPVMSSNEGGSAAANMNGNTSRGTATVIDLTAEDESGDLLDNAPEPEPASFRARAQRLPRFDRNIFGDESEGEEGETHARTSINTGPNLDNLYPPRNQHNPELHPRYSSLRRPQRPPADPTVMDDLEFIEERPRANRPGARSHNPAQRSITPFPGGGDTIDLTGDDNDDVVYQDTRPRPGGINNDRPTLTGGIGTAIADLFEQTDRLRARFGDVFGVGAPVRAQRQALERITHERHRNFGTNNARRREDGMPRVGMAPAMMITMDYATPAFGMGYAGANEPTQPKYEPPPEAAAGFTRSPGENEEVVCCNCGDELAVGESDEKQEIWVIKKCGHAYCGDCARNRVKSAKSSKKGKGKAPVDAGPPTFKQCVVDGCKESAIGKAFLHIFVGS